MAHKKANILWVDAETLYCWKSNIHMLKDKGHDVTELTLSGINYILKVCEGKDIIIYHCGTVTPHEKLVEKLIAIKTAYPEIKIILQTESKSADVAPYIDNILPKLTYQRYLENLIRETLEG